MGNTVRKLLHQIREEYENATRATPASKPEYSIENFVLMGQSRKQTAAAKLGVMPVLKDHDAEDPDSFARVLKPLLMEAIQELLDDLETVYENIARNAKDHIHSE